MTRRFVVLTTLAALAGCAATGGPSTKEDLGDAVFADGDLAADAFTRRLDMAGVVGVPERLVGTFSETGFTGYTFVADAGDRVVIDVAGHGNDPVLYVYGPQRHDDWRAARPIARNDDWNGSLSSHLELSLPFAGTYLVLTREYWNDGGEFTLTMGCAGDHCGLECGPGGSCPQGAACEYRVCVRAPCPSYCRPIDTSEPDVGGEGAACGSRGLEPCAEGLFCHWAESAICGATDIPGVCTTIPTACTEQYEPVCGCDGRDFPNACFAAMHGISVASQGECGAPTCDPIECGPRLGLATLLCSDGSVGGNTGRCLRNDDGTCGWEIRECPTSETACGGRLGDTCADGEFCSYPESAICGRADATGTCEPRPEICTREYMPVCGCDGRTYGNRCSAAAAGVSVDHEGACDDGCRIAGCSGQLCVGADDPGITTCEWREEYACYRTATCERQPSGACGWTPTRELEACLASGGPRAI